MHAQAGGGNPRRQHCEGGVRHAPPPSLARAEDGGARGNAILAVLVLEAAVVVANVNVLKKIRALHQRHRAVVLVIGPDERRQKDVARGEGHGGWWLGRAYCLSPS